MRFIRGEGAIMTYLKQNCLQPLQVGGESNELFFFDSTSQDECRVDAECDK